MSGSIAKIINEETPGQRFDEIAHEGLMCGMRLIGIERFLILEIHRYGNGVALIDHSTRAAHRCATTEMLHSRNVRQLTCCSEHFLLSLASGFVCPEKYDVSDHKARGWKFNWLMIETSSMPQDATKGKLVSAKPAQALVFLAWRTTTHPYTSSMPRISTFLPSLIVMIFCAAPIQAEQADAANPARELTPQQAADHYAQMHEEVVSFARKLASTHDDAQYFYHILDGLRSPSEAERSRMLTFCKDFFRRLHELTQTPIAKWGEVEYYNEAVPVPSFMLVSHVLELNRLARWYAFAVKEEAPQDALEAVFSAARAGRHLNSEPTLTTFLVKVASDSMALQTLASMSEEMSPLRRNAVVIFWDSLPDTGTLEGALHFERDVFLGWIERALLRAAEKYPQPDPAMVTREQERRVHAERMIRGDDKQVKERRQVTVREARTIPWAAILEVFRDRYHFVDPEASDTEARAHLQSMGITPENALFQLREAKAAYSALLAQLYSPYSEIEAWATKQNYQANPFNSALPEHVEAARRIAMQETAFFYGLSLLEGAVAKPANGSLIELNGHYFRYRENAKGFRLEQSWHVPADAPAEAIPMLRFYP